MNFRDLQAFIAVAESGSISLAARRLHLTQPAITRRVQNFESATGGPPLFDRSAKPLTLTAAGRQVLDHCRGVQQAIATLKMGAAGNGEPCGELRVGVGMGAEMILGSPIDELRRKFPRIELRLSANWTARLIEALCHKELDVALAFVTRDHVVPDSMQMTALGSETIAVVASRDFVPSRSRGKPWHLRDLAEQRWVLNPVGCAYRLAVQRAHDAAGIPLRIAAEVIGRDLQMSLVARGAGLGLLSRRMFRGGNYRRSLRIVPVADFNLESTLAVLRAPALGRFSAVVDLLEKRVAHALRP